MLASQLVENLELFINMFGDREVVIRPGLPIISLVFDKADPDPCAPFTIVDPREL